MNLDLQKASMWKRIAAWVLDFILICVLATGFAALLSLVTGYDTQNEKLEGFYRSYETKYGISFDLTEDESQKLSEEELNRYQEAYDALLADAEAVHTYSVVVNLTLLITSLGIFLSCFLLEFLIPVFLGNGQTVGKKIFGLCVIGGNCVRIRTVALFVRSILGKYTVELMIPVFLVILIYFNGIGIMGPVVMILLLLLQLGLVIFTGNHSAIHDVLSGTVVADMASQRIFDSVEDLIAYQKKLAAEIAEQSDY